ncbi:unnamed protein product [Didymodactylos carnosus]|uniref:Uncharacterized protein n=1 Tax=Didymodactylos carnosus TaxID=1234261 RepID=A0A814ARH7_9BILA|nr:unnamed protein product [Didymodactylos carnosus]CAF1511912.1 unnamed protein product [Didymodactylos carnosus]CAF3698758.1 unnamed protein product [Didymodactylos carnosus]CAF4299602.1 unnamed protein product [Didymodactylos carnosus]
MASHYSKKLDCQGHACTRCGYCRDWYHNDNRNINERKYHKREDATCVYADAYYCDTHVNCRDGCDVNAPGHSGHTLLAGYERDCNRALCNRSGFYNAPDVSRLCECEKKGKK